MRDYRPPSTLSVERASGIRSLEPVTNGAWLARNTDVPTVVVPQGPPVMSPDRAHLARLEELRCDAKMAIREAREHLAELLEADATAEKLDISFAQASVLASGITVGGDPLDVARASELARSARQFLSGEELPPLVALGEGGVALGRPEKPLAERAITFVLESAAVGADPVLARYKANAHLVIAGYPWLAPSFAGVADYRRGLHMTKNLLRGDTLVESLVSGSEERRRDSECNWWWQGN